MSKDDDVLSPEESFRVFGQKMMAESEPFKWTKTPTHIPAKRPVKVYTIELSDPTLRIATSPTPYKNTLN
ncbi:hypothetical protein [Tateyamaria sp.]|uniref:hypothetical protein n=1 Tax=Tateyamaria sp. TaxID=1929288 RepID=UPI0032A0295E